MPTLERARAKHNELVTQLAKANDAKDKALDVLIRREAKRASLIRAVARSSKRLDKLKVAAIHTNGPTATVKPGLVEAVATKPTPAQKLNDPVPTFKTEPKLGTPGGKLVRDIPYTEAHPHSKMAKKRRTVEDFKADMAGKKLAAGLGDGGQV
jgi:hypothetical protein